MSILHTVNKSPFQSNSLERCLAMAKEGSALLLFEDGVYAAQDGSKYSSMIRDAMGKLKICALEPDLAARGMNSKIIDGVTLVDYAGFVDLAAEYESTQSWL